jgi:hypothetical protein
MSHSMSGDAAFGPVEAVIRPYLEMDRTDTNES